MEAKKKAEELIEKFMRYSYLDEHDMTTRQRREASNIDSAIECALIAIEESINELQSYSDLESIIVYNEVYSSVIERLNYWQEVKEELLKL